MLAQNIWLKNLFYSIKCTLLVSRVRLCAVATRRVATEHAIYPPLNDRAGAHELDRPSFVARQTSKRLSDYE